MRRSSRERSMVPRTAGEARDGIGGGDPARSSQARVPPLVIAPVLRPVLALLVARRMDRRRRKRPWKHSYPGTTYGHLVPDYLRSEIDRLRIDAAPAEEPSNGSHSPAGFSPPLLTTFLQGNRSESSGPSNGDAISESSSELASAGWTGLEPAASAVTGRRYNRLNYHPRFSTGGELPGEEATGELVVVSRGSSTPTVCWCQRFPGHFRV
jgi:hypothetical protein